MSEIFNLLKRTDFENKKSIDETPVLFPLDADGETEQPVAALDPPKTEIEFSPEPECRKAEPAPIKVDMHSTAALNLDMADYRIRNVWDPVTLVGEQFRVLRAKLASMQKERRIKILLVTSAVPGEGKTFVACGLAGVLAQQPGNRVLLVDSDLRKPKAALDLGINNEADLHGFADVLSGRVEPMDAVMSSKEAALYFLPAGKRPDNPAELLSSGLLARSLQLFSEHFNWIIIDSPPVIALADTSVLSPLCDAVLLVAYANQTSSKLIKDCIQSIGREKICGVIMNRAKHAKSSHYYYSYYKKEPRS
jgi:capsular exopolysaccharide synthesis family protein